MLILIFGQSQYDWVGDPYSDEGHDDSTAFNEDILDEPGNP